MKFICMRRVFEGDVMSLCAITPAFQKTYEVCMQGGDIGGLPSYTDAACFSLEVHRRCVRIETMLGRDWDGEP